MRSKQAKITTSAVLLILVATGYSLWPRQREAIGIPPEEQAYLDSLSLKVAVMPTYGCLPFYWAKEHGIYDSLGVPVKLITYQAQMDCDTAFQRGVIECGYTDLIRAARMQSIGVGLYVFAEIEEKMYFITQRKQRIREAKELKEKTMGIARLSLTDYLAETLIANSQVNHEDVYLPQINDVRLRAEMLCNEQIDATILPEPYASMTAARGHRTIQELPHNMTCMAITYAALNDTTRVEQTKRLIEGYNIAATQINELKSLRQLDKLLEPFNLPHETVDSIAVPQYTALRLPTSNETLKAVNFLLKREETREPKQISTTYKGDTLLTIKLL